MTSLGNLPAFLAYFICALVLLGAFLAIYTWVTPMDDWGLIRSGNRAAAISLVGAASGFALPLASAIAHSVNLGDMVVWGAVALVLQLACFALVRRLIGNLVDEIRNDHIGCAIVLAGASIILGLLNAACLTT